MLERGRARRGPGQILGILLGTLLILAIGVYGPLTLLGPLPAAQATVTTPPPASVATATPVLPAEGASAVTLDASSAPITATGETKPVPMAGITKIVTALVVLKAKPMAAGRTGPAITITADDYRSYIDYGTRDARTVIVFPGEIWTEREMMQALILGSSNNHADSLARWAYGSIDSFLTAANAWLTANGMTHTHLADATGLNEHSAGTASDLARLAAVAMTDPTIAELISNPATSLANQRGVQNTTSFLAGDGITGISRSFTDAAGVCFLFSATVTVGGKPFPFFGALLREPSYDSLTADLTALMAGARTGVHEITLIRRGTAYVTLRTAWGATAHGVASRSVTVPGWQLAAPKTTVGTKPVRAGSATDVIGTVAVGTVTVSRESGKSEIPLLLDTTIADPGPGWRLLNPVPVIAALLNPHR